ncbi:MAG: TetR/AcrR family transcriptional regulator [Myxococcales bacterium]|nr:TetR/AcrR family transcriptional regulator [Myxococcales bacterium]MDD9969334.1 TetR/AcrR family transcriptional regulator [Myxococcales bacterium]
MARRPPPRPPRRRLPADEARARILEAAQRRLAEVGPERLRLTELAAELGISHQAILHHFGTREHLVGAVVERATMRLNERMTSVLAERGRDREELFDLIADFYGAEGNARLIAWLALSGMTPETRPAAAQAHPLKAMIELAHASRTNAQPDREIPYEDTEFRSQLVAVALLGEAIFGDLIRASSGSQRGPAATRAFRKRLAALLVDSG